MKKTKLALIVVLLIVCENFVFSFMGSAKTKETVSDNSIKYYENVVAITFDDGPRRESTTKLLDGLNEMNVKATFFVIGEYIEGNEDLIKRMYEEGHLIGNHTYSHIDLSSQNENDDISDIEKNNSLIYQITGYWPKYIRPPFGKYSDNLLNKVNMTPVLWSVDPNDWKTTNVHSVVTSVVKKVKSGDIILLHDFYDTSVEAALEIVAELKAKGYIFVTVDQILLD